MLDNESTVHAASLCDGDRVFLLERCSPSSSHRTSPVGDRQSHSLISDIWSTSDYISSSEDEDLTLPAALLEDDSQLHLCSRKSTTRSKQRQKQSSEFRSRVQSSDLARTKSTYRTKMCRVGAANCKFGHN